MTVQTPSAPTSDAELLNRVREGESEAYGVLYRRHADAARRLATVLTHDRGEGEDLAAEAFAKVLASLRAGGGPQTAFRPYLLTAVRNAFYDRVRRSSRVEPTDTIEDYEKPEPYEDPSIAALERSYAARAFARLPERWRAVLWHTEVEGESPTQIAPLFGLSANAVAVLAYRARERLKQGYLAEHITLTGSPRCHWTGEHLPGYVRANLAGRDRTKVEDHLAECSECRRLHRELTDANVSLRVVLAPLLLGVAAPGYLESSAARGGVAVLLTMLVSLVAKLSALPGQAWAGLRFAWWWLATLPQRLARRYGAANVAAASGLVVAAALGVAMFVTAAVLFPAAPRTHHTDAADLPVPAPAQTDYTGPAYPVPSAEPSTRTIPSAAPPTRPARSAAPGRSVAPPGSAPPAAEAVGVRPDAAAPGLIAGGVNRIPLAFSRTESATLGREESTVLSAFETTARETLARRGWEFGLELPDGFRLAGSDAGDRWTCRTTGKSVHCLRPGTPAGSTARVPVAIDPSATGYQTITVRLPQKTQVFRIPVAPAGMRVAYSGTGRLRTAAAGNALLSCLPRPACLSQDNNTLDMLPFKPLPTEPAAPAGLSTATAVSGALLDLPAKARIRWAGLTVAASGGKLPDVVAVHGRTGGWNAVRVTISAAESANLRLRQAYADVTSLIRANGDGRWWVAVPASRLSPGQGQYAGWSVLVAYELPAAPAAEVAAYVGPVVLEGRSKVAVKLSSAATVTTSVVAWDGDQALHGDRLTLGGRPIGNVFQGRSPGRTPGLDIAQYAAKTAGDSTVTVEAGDDPVALGLLAVAQTVRR